MQWTDEAIVLSARRHGETSSVLSVLTRERGRHAGLLRGGAARRRGGMPQPGGTVVLTWRGRLAEHLGQFAVESLDARSAGLLDDAARLAGLTAALAVAELALPERQPHPAVHRGLTALIDVLLSGDALWSAAYVRWELGVLADLGYGLALERCALTGRTEGLSHVSPRTGRAVARDPAAPYADRLLRLPGFLAPGGDGSVAAADVADGLALTGHFLDRHVFAAQGRAAPPARLRLADRFHSGRPTPERIPA